MRTPGMSLTQCGVTLTVVLATIATAVTLAFSATSATAAEVDQLTCVGTQDVAQSPGLKFTKQIVTMKDHVILSPCESATDETLTSGTAESEATNETSCSQLFTSHPGTKVFHWDNGKTSTFAYSITFEDVGGDFVGTATGTITAGEFAGASAQAILTGVVDPLECLTSEGLTSIGEDYVFDVLQT